MNKPYRGEGPQPRPAAAAFDWTGLAWSTTTGPAPNFSAPRRRLSTSGRPRSKAQRLARAGVEVTAVDFSHAQVERARRLWDGEPRLTFVPAEACAFLDQAPHRFDVI
ncbi:class I SAM-dependent methyltransferase [Streptomyces hydrogenans]|uniref:class I SAM-dependent methyltransferase n=1 Tax=Streptomyces hydrogenans TaxID=1873719 RepID=UPI0037F6A5C2